MSSQLDTRSVQEPSAAQRIDGEIYVSLPTRKLRLRGALLLVMLTVAGASAALAGYLQSESIQAGKFSKGETQCPGMSPAQKTAAQPKKS